MQQHKFQTYEEYVEAQTSLTRRKTRGGRTKLCTTPNALQAVYAYHVRNVSLRSGWKPPEVRYALCHGVRHGEELRIFERLFRCGEWTGTEITPDLCDGKKVICQDFTYRREDWIGRFDFIYSNALDHSKNPWKTLRTWMNQLSPDGRLYVEWCTSSTLLGRRYNKADCFAADEREHRRLLNRFGCVEDTIRLNEIHPKKHEPMERIIFVVKKKSS